MHPAFRARTELPPYPRCEAVDAWGWVWEHAEFRFLGAEESARPEGWSSPGLEPHSTVVLVVEGAATCTVAGRPVAARDGDLLWVPESTPYAVRTRGPVWHAVGVRFTARVAGAHCLLSLLGFPPVVRDLQGALQDFRELVRLQRYTPGGWRQRASALVAALVLRVVHEQPHHLTPDAAVRQLRALRWLCPVLQLAGRSDGRVAVQDVARALSWSATHLRRVFRAALGVSPHQWLLERRLKRAADLLATTEQPVEEVARVAGYESVSHFHRSFKRRFGCTPAQYRARLAGRQDLG